MLDSWHSYPSIYSVGHRAVRNLLTVPVSVEEKVDGSQFSFGVFPNEADGEPELRIRSKNVTMIPDAPAKMFNKAAALAKELAPQLRLGWTYRGEYLAKPKHNALAYNRVPAGSVILFDINSGHEEYLSQWEKREEANRLGLEVVPLLHDGTVNDIGQFRQFLDRESVLGGQQIEGVVIKPKYYDVWAQDKKCLMAKFVSEAFKEIHRHSWTKDNPTAKDILSQLGDDLTTAARWQKALLHLREAGKIQDAPQDIALLVREVPDDIKAECEGEIRDRLFAYAWPHLRRLVIRGLSEWYKDQLLQQQFNHEPA